jgi:hypothetical protein
LEGELADDACCDARREQAEAALGVGVDDVLIRRARIAATRVKLLGDGRRARFGRRQAQLLAVRAREQA